MADTNDVPMHLHRHSKRVPDDILKRLSTAELRARCELAEHHHRTASAAPVAEHARYLTAQAVKVLRSVPAVEYIGELRRLRELLDGASTSPSLDPFWPRSMADVYRERVRAFKTEHVYPAGLIAAVDAVLIGKRPADSTLASLADACVSAAVW